MPGLDAPVLAWLGDHHGVITIGELAALGVTDRRRDPLVAHGLLVPVHRGVYRSIGSPETPLGRARSVCAAHDDYVVASRTAARLWALRRIPADPHLDALALHGTPALRAPWARLRRTTWLPESDIVTRPDGIRLTSPPRTVFDLAAHLDPAAFESVVEQVLDQYCTLPTLLATAEPLLGRGRPGSARFRAVLGSRPARLRPVQSDLELQVLSALRRAGLPLERQFVLRVHTGTIRLDAADPSIRWGLEIDHVTWHGGRLDAQADKARDRSARLAGWQVERVTDRELADRFDAVVAELVALHRQRAAEVASRGA